MFTGYPTTSSIPVLTSKQPTSSLIPSSETKNNKPSVIELDNAQLNSEYHHVAERGLIVIYVVLGIIGLVLFLLLVSLITKNYKKNSTMPKKDERWLTKGKVKVD